MHGAYEGELPDGWQSGVPVTKYWNGDYIKLYRVTRPCATCNAEISIDVTKKALQGSAKNSGLLLRNCPTCRAARKAGGPGSRGGTSRPVAAAEGAVTAVTVVDNTKLEELRAELAEVTRERDEAWEANVNGMVERGKLVRELEALKARLAVYELPAAMAAQNGFDPHKALAAEIAKKKMPWS